MKTKKNLAAYAVALLASLFLGFATTSCEESTALGVIYDEPENPNEKPGDSGYFYPESGIEMAFDTTTMQLYTVKQNITGTRAILEMGDTIEKVDFSRDLNLEVNFSLTPAKVYVAEESLLNDVVRTENVATEVSAYEDEDDEFCTINKSRSYIFVFNANETVKADAVWQALRCDMADTTFACAEVKNVAYKDFVAALNQSLSNADSTVYDIDLHFNVELACEKKAWDSTYVVTVPEVRIYKHGYIPPVPDEYETKLENAAYEAAFSTKTLSLVTDYQTVSGDIVTYKNGVEEISRENFAKDLNLQALFTAPSRVYVNNEAELGNVSLTGSGAGSDYLSRNADGRFITATSTLDYDFEFNEGETVKAATEYQFLTYGDTTFTYSEIRNIRFNRAEVSDNAAASNETMKVKNVTLYFDVEVVRVESDDIETRAISSSETYEVAVPYERALRIEAPKDELEGKTYRDLSREIIDANTERISWTEVETWSVSGEKTNTISFNLYRHFSSPAMQTIYTANDQYNTASNGSKLIREEESENGNWTVTTRYMQYSSTANNGVDPFNNVYAYDYQKAVYANEYYTLSFDYADWTISEAGSSVAAAGEQTVSGIVYNVSNYVNNINTVYSISNDRYDAAAKAEARIYVEKPIEKIIPDAWGKIIGAGISAVPADDVNGDFAKKCFTLRTEKGAVAIVFDMAAEMPSVSNVLSGNFVEGNFNAAFNSGYWRNGAWQPGIAEDWSDRLVWKNQDSEDLSAVVRNLRHSTLSMWDWRDGNFSTVVNGYTFTVTNDGLLTVTYNGEVVLQLR